MTPETLLLRQIHPSFVQGGRVTSQAFRPTPKDDNLLSVYDADQISASESLQHFLAQPDCKSCGVMAISNGECAHEELVVIPDGVPFDSHVSVDFSAHPKGEIEKKSKTTVEECTRARLAARTQSRIAKWAANT